MATPTLQGQPAAGRFKQREGQLGVPDAEQAGAEVELSERQEDVRGPDKPEEGAAVHEAGHRHHGRGQIGRTQQAGRTQHTFVFELC